MEKTSAENARIVYQNFNKFTLQKILDFKS
jgi:hypothetical protein